MSTDRRRHSIIHAVAAVAWLAVPFTVGDAVGAALETSSRAVQVVASAGLWSGWGVVALALAVPTSVTLTVLRAAAPAPLALTAVAVATGHGTAAAAIVASVVAATAASPDLGARFVQGSAYGDERRLPLRVPAALWFGPLPIAWLAGTAAITTGPLLLAAEQWAFGVVASGAGIVVVALVGRALHGLSRRFVVFVPAGFVLHDPFTLVDPVLFPRRLVRRLGPAAADSDSLDLTAGAAGLALELELTESVPMTLAPTGWRRRGPGQTGRTARLLFTPTRPGLVLTEARARRLPVAAPTESQPQDDAHAEHGGTAVRITPTTGSDARSSGDDG